MAADKQAGNQGTLSTVTKLIRLDVDGDIHGLATCGDADWGLELIEWYKQTLGSNPATYPQNDKEFKARLIVGNKYRVLDYCNRGYPATVEDGYMAWGSGRDVALGALFLGASPCKAIQAAMFHLDCCGRGVDEVVF